MSKIMAGSIPSKAESQTRMNQTPKDTIPLPVEGPSVQVDENIVKALPIPGSTLFDACKFSGSTWGEPIKLTARLPDGTVRRYFVKIVPNLGDVGCQMCEGESETLKTIEAISPGFVPKPYAWGKTRHDAHFLLVEFRDISWQFSKNKPADPERLAECLADLHKRSASPTGKFGFHVATCHAKIPQAVDCWDDSWCAVFAAHLARIVNVASPILQWPEFDLVARLTLDKVVPRLLLPLQPDGRVLKPCLVHGDCWDGNTAIDANTGEAFIFDVCSFYGHNEYDTGNRRAPRHRLSDEAYIRNYKRHFPVSQPAEDWNARNLLYSLPYDIGNTIHVPDQPKDKSCMGYDYLV